MDSPPPQPEFLNITPQSHVTFEELDDALKMVKGAESTAFAISLIYGCVCAPNMVAPSDYLPLVLGADLRLPDQGSAQRVLSLLFAVHNQMSEMIEDNLPLNLRRSSYSSDKAGLILRVDDLLHELEGFQEGLFSGVDRKSDLPRSCAEHVAQLVLE